MHLKLLLLASLLVLANGKEQHAKRIRGGLTAGQGEFPYQVSIQAKHLLVLYRNICSGALIKSNYVLTAARCVVDRPMRVRAGFITQFSLGGKYMEVTSKTIHPNYNQQTTANDIALLKLRDSFPLGNTIGIVKLPAANSVPTGQGILAGWGTTYGILQIQSNSLLKANFTIITEQQCKSALGSALADRLQNSNFCGQSSSVAACSGDEGASLVQNNITIGVKSWIQSTCNNGQPAVFTTVSNYTSWINGVINS